MRFWRWCVPVVLVAALAAPSAMAAALPSDARIKRELVNGKMIRQTGYPFALDRQMPQCVPAGATGRTCGVGFTPTVRGAYPYFTWITAFTSQPEARRYFADVVSKPTAGSGESLRVFAVAKDVFAYVTSSADGSRPPRAHVEVLLGKGTAGAECTWVLESTVAQISRCAEQVAQRQALEALPLLGKATGS